MRVTILAHNLHIGGGYVVGINFISALCEASRGHQYQIIAPGGVGYEDVTLPKGSATVTFRDWGSMRSRWKFDHFELPRLVKDFAPQVILGLGNIGLPAPSCKQAILIHKPHLLYPSKHYSREAYLARVKNWLLKVSLRKCLRHTDMIFCQTPVTRERFAKTFSYPCEKIKIMPMGVSELIKVGREVAGKPAIFEQGDYFNLFFLSKFYAHKNFEILISLFRKHRDRLSNVRVITTVSADQHPNAVSFLNDIERYNLQEHIVNVGPLRQCEVAGYYYNSDAFFLPTLLETFGLPYIEAMHFGLPILTSDLDFARFVCSDSAEYFDPWDTDDITQKISAIRDSAELRERLISRGKKELGRFLKGWPEIADGVINELEGLED